MFSISNLNGYSMLVVDENAGEIIFLPQRTPPL